ncbi:MAG: Rpn family recombination-promoting nuclease/putative transposase [Opitutales bacterium]
MTETPADTSPGAESADAPETKVFWRQKRGLAPAALALFGLLLFTVDTMLAFGVLALAGVAATRLVHWRVDPVTRQKLVRFQRIKRGYWSFLIVFWLTVLSLFAELFVNGRALVVHYEGTWHFPIYGDVILGEAFGLTGEDAFTPVNYRRLDALFEAAFGEPSEAASLFRSLLPPSLASRVDADRLTLEPGSFVDEALADRHTDLLYACQLDGQEALIYLLLEHQSTVDPLMAYRIYRYIERILDRWLSGHPGAARLPAVIPLVVYNGARPWTAPTDLRALVELRDSMNGGTA